MVILTMLQREEERDGSSLVAQVLEGIAYDQEIAHYPEVCMFCMIDSFGNWDYCPCSRYHVDCQGHSPSKIIDTHGKPDRPLSRAR